MLTTTGRLRLCNSGLLTRADVHCSVSCGQLLRYWTVPVLNGILSGPFKLTSSVTLSVNRIISNNVTFLYKKFSGSTINKGDNRGKDRCTKTFISRIERLSNVGDLHNTGSYKH